MRCCQLWAWGRDLLLAGLVWLVAQHVQFYISQRRPCRLTSFASPLFCNGTESAIGWLWRVILDEGSNTWGYNFIYRCSVLRSNSFHVSYSLNWRQLSTAVCNTIQERIGSYELSSHEAETVGLLVTPFCQSFLDLPYLLVWHLQGKLNTLIHAWMWQYHCARQSLP